MAADHRSDWEGSACERGHMDCRAGGIPVSGASLSGNSFIFLNNPRPPSPPQLLLGTHITGAPLKRDPLATATQLFGSLLSTHFVHNQPTTSSTTNPDRHVPCQPGYIPGALLDHHLCVQYFYNSETLQSSWNPPPGIEASTIPFRARKGKPVSRSPSAFSPHFLSQCSDRGTVTVR